MRRSRGIAAGLAVWCGLIVATSSTVILPHDFFAWIARHLLTEEASFQRFATFWGASWFVIVKGWHAAEYAILFALVLGFLTWRTRLSAQRRILLAAAASILFAMTDEYHQTFVPGRGGTWTDVAIDSLGVLAAAGVARWRTSVAEEQAATDLPGGR